MFIFLFGAYQKVIGGKHEVIICYVCRIRITSSTVISTKASWVFSCTTSQSQYPTDLLIREVGAMIRVPFVG